MERRCALCCQNAFGIAPENQLPLILSEVRVHHLAHGTRHGAVGPEQDAFDTQFSHGELNLPVVEIAAADIDVDVRRCIPHLPHGVFPVAATADVCVNEDGIREPRARVGKMLTI